MTDNITQKLEWRLRSIANGSYKSNRDESGQCSLLYVELLIMNGDIIGWIKPEVKPIEPRGINPLDLNPKRVANWAMAIEELVRLGKGTIILQRSEPVGIMK